MFFNIKSSNNVSTGEFYDERFDVYELSEIFRNVKHIKEKAKEFLKSNKYIKYKKNGSDYIELAPNSKFFKKFPELEEQEDEITRLMSEFIETYYDSDLKDKCHYLTIDFEVVANKAVFCITI